jgi:hypothetical protein
MSATKKASLVDLKKFFFGNADGALQDFNNQRKQLTPKDQEELCDWLGTEIEKGSIVLG